jgi:hypothetical protein
MDNEFRWQFPRRRNHCFSHFTATLGISDPSAFFQYLAATCLMDCAVDTAPAQQ